MSLFNYILPSGAEFTVRGPAGATQAQADRIFYEQVAAGALVGYQSGQTLTSTATQITKFELSRLDRGTAAVDNSPVLAISQGLVTASGVVAPSVLQAVQSLPRPTSLPNLANVPLTSPIDEADIVLVKGDDLAPSSIGANGVTALSEYQTQKILAQIVNLVDQDSDQITRDKGIGQYGFTAYTLEQAGLVKPGTSLRFFAVDPEDFVSVMSSPSVWTGRNGIYSLDDLLNDPATQTQTQTRVMQQVYNDLLANGTITTTPQPSVKLSTGQVFTNSGLQSASALTALSLLGTNLGSLSGIARNAVTSSTALNRLISTANVNLSTIGSGAVNSLTASLGNLGNLSTINFAGLTQGLTTQITGGVGALVANASKFGSEATALWAKAGGLSFDSIGSGISNFASSNLNNLTAGLGGSLNNITGQFTSLASGITGSLNGITSNLTNLVPGSLSNLTSSLNTFGKAGSFATNFANPLGSLGNLGALQGQLTGALTGQLGSLTGALGSFANIGAVSDLFGGGGDLVSGTTVAAGFNNTVNRATVDAAFARVVGSDKIPLPTFQYPSPASLAPRLDIQQAQNFLRNLSTSGGGTFGQTVTI